jgi:hypothetical protein
MSIVFSGSAGITTAVTDGTKQTLINNLETALLALGWTTASGHGTATLVMQSGTTPNGFQMAARIMDQGGTNIQVFMESYNSGYHDTYDTSHGATLLVNTGITYTVIGSPYQFLVLNPNTQGRSFVWNAMLYCPSYLSQSYANLSFQNNNSNGDTQGGNFTSIMSCPSLVSGPYSFGNTEVLLDNLYWGADSGSVVAGMPRLVLGGFVVSDWTNPVILCQWADGTYFMNDVFVAFSAPSSTAQVQGQVFDAAYISMAAPVGATTSVSGHTLYNVTNNYGGGSNTSAPPGGIWFAIN